MMLFKFGNWLQIKANKKFQRIKGVLLQAQSRTVIPTKVNSKYIFPASNNKSSEPLKYTVSYLMILAIYNFKKYWHVSFVLIFIVI